MFEYHSVKISHRIISIGHDWVSDIHDPFPWMAGGKSKLGSLFE